MHAYDGHWQASSLKRYPAQLSLTAWMCTVGGIQSTVFTLFMQHEPEEWRIGFGVKFWSIVYSGLACNGFTVFVQLWCTEKKGPVFVTMFNPLSTIMVAILAYFIFGENLYVGRYGTTHMRS
jgi:drug/metabolite transporter (DMT)-like permease